MPSRLDGAPADLAATASAGIANAGAVSQYAGGHAPQILAAAQEAFITGWQQVMRVDAAVMTVLVLFVLLRGPQSSPALTADPVAGGENGTGDLNAQYDV